MIDSAGAVPYELKLVDDGYAYKDKVGTDDIPFPCNEYYDAKAWRWLLSNIGMLEQPIVFWNIGS